MSATWISAPGTKYGPCKEACGHRDCAASRADAEKVCKYCGKFIGYETAYYADGPEKDRFASLVHQICELKAIEAEESKVTK